MQVDLTTMGWVREKDGSHTRSGYRLIENYSLLLDPNWTLETPDGTSAGVFFDVLEAHNKVEELLLKSPWEVIDQQEGCQTLQRGPWTIIDDAHDGIRIDFMNIDGVKYYYPPTNLQEAKDWTYEMDLKDEPIVASAENHPMNPSLPIDGPPNMNAIGKEIPLLVTTEYTVPKETYQQLFAEGPLVASSDKSDPKASFGTKKPGMSLIPGTALMMLAKVMALGAKKYGAYNWRSTEVRASVYIDALFRHTFQWWDGEDIDPESGAPHLAHAMACLAIILDALAQGTLIDDRPTAGRTNNVIKELTEQ